MTKVITAIVVVMAIGLLMTETQPRTSMQAVSLTSIDADHDFCLDSAEFGSDPNRGGDRSPKNRWDFYDVVGWDSENWRRAPPDGKVNALDIAYVGFRVGSKDGDLLYNWWYDRAAGGDDPGDFANLGPPDGAITKDDFYAALAQHGDQCEQPTVDVDSLCELNRKEAEAAGVTKYNCVQEAVPGAAGQADVVELSDEFALPPLEVVGGEEPGSAGSATATTVFWRWKGAVDGRPYGSWLAVEQEDVVEAAAVCTLNCGEPNPEPIRTKTCRIRMKDEFDYWGPGSIVFEELELEVTFEYYRPWAALYEDTIAIREDASAGGGWTYSDLTSGWWVSRTQWPRQVTAYVRATFTEDALGGWFHPGQHNDRLEEEIDGTGHCYPYWDADGSISTG